MTLGVLTVEAMSRWKQGVLVAVVTAGFVLVTGGGVAFGGGTPPVPTPVVTGGPLAPDSMDRYTIDYDLTEDGVLNVTETIVYRFGPRSGRHGIYRDLITREPYDENGDGSYDEGLDRVYEISNIQVESPSAPAAYERENSQWDKDRSAMLRLKIGDPYSQITAATAQYVIRYQVRGALQHIGDHSELYWDATGLAWQAELNQVTVTVRMPQGSAKVACYAGGLHSTKPCTRSSTVNGQAVITQDHLPSRSGLTVSVSSRPGAILSGDQAIIEKAPNLLARAGLGPISVSSSLAAVLAIALGGFWLARRSTNLRYADLPPGTLPPSGLTARVVPDRLPADSIPVTFQPPAITVGEAGLLLDGSIDTRDTAATLIDLAVRGALRIDADRGPTAIAVLIDPYTATALHEQVLIRQLWPDLNPGSQVSLTGGAFQGIDRTRLSRAHDATALQLAHRAAESGWYVRLPAGLRSSQLEKNLMAGGCMLLGVMGGFAAVGAGGIIFIGSLMSGVGLIAAIMLPLIAAVITGAVLILRRRSGRRSAAGQAVLDQVIGFRTYLATAEADQLRFAAGEDIFSKYLPWAVVFDLAERWRMVCAQLFEQGRLPAETSWCSGGPTAGFALATGSTSLASSFESASMPTGGSGGGGSSSSSGSSSGSSGGGGGGGGGGSW